MLEYNLVENALHSLNEAINYYMEGDEKDNIDQYKFSILLTSHCAELLIKEILRMNHPSLIFEDIDKIKNGDFDQDDVCTVGYVIALNRVKNICGIDLGRYHSYLRDLGIIRNRIQHFKCYLDAAYCKKLMAQAFSSIEYIMQEILKLKFEDYKSVICTSQIDFLHEDKEAYEARKRDIQEDIRSKKLRKFGIEYIPNKIVHVPCPICGEELLVLENEKIKCLWCANEYISHNEIYENDQSCFVASNMSRAVGRRRGLIRYPIYECPLCENETLTYCITEQRWICWVCGTSYDEFAYCDDCGNEMPNDEKFYHTAISYLDAGDFKYLCPGCASKATNSEEYMDYEIS